MTFKEYDSLNLVDTAARVLEQWKKEDTFGQSIALRQGAPDFVFFEGPPSANGMPGIHHVMARSIKDSICRYRTMTGYKVRRRAGWDTHGLPVELGVEKKLGITKEDIGTKISIEDYNNTCRKEVMKYTAEWVNLTERVGYWVDMNDPYITYDNRYIETLWYLLKKIYDKGLLYKGKTIQPYSPAAGTGLSSHELNQPGCYKDVKDTTCTAQFTIKRTAASEKLFEGSELPVYFLAWTTTPWTLPSNTALCVGPSIDYVLVEAANPYSGKKARYVLAQALLDSVFTEKEEKTVIGEPFKGKSLVGIEYEQLIPWFRPDEGAFRVISGDYVTTEDGTGIVHIAPTFGADDMKVARIAGVPGLIVTDRNGDPQAQVDPRGRFYRLEDLDPKYVSDRVSPDYAQWAGRFVKNAYDDSLPADAPTLDIDICMLLKEQGKAFRILKQVHNYPHCWRTDKPILYYPLDSWFIKASAVREQMMELNESINWKPESTGSGRFGKWLENIQDWNLSRSRYWGTPLPIWRTEDGKAAKCIGSVKELFDEIDKSVKAGIMKTNPLRDKGFNPADMSKSNYDRIDLHRPWVDEICLVSEDGRKMVREKDLIDVWFDSGAMPYAQEGLRNLGNDAFGCTADFIAEGVDQTRGWFYTLHAIHTMISGTPAFKTVISNGLVLDKKGEKMSKRLGNAVDPFKILDTYGPDATRWYMLTNAQPWDNLKFDEAEVDEVRRKFFSTLYNTYSFFALYANVDKFDPTLEAVPTDKRAELDRWIISLQNTLIKQVREAYDNYDLTTAGRLIQDFVCDNLSNWYVRLARKRFWGGEMTTDKLSAHQTLYGALKCVALLAAPIAPFYMDRLYMDLTGEGKSVHLCDMPSCDDSLVDKDLEQRMSLAQTACSMVLALRRKVGINVRKPLAKLVIPVLNDEVKKQLLAVKDIILGEVNVKDAEFIHDTTGLITKKIKPNFKTLGKAYGKMMKEIAAAFASMDQTTIAAIESAGTYTLKLSSDVVLKAGDYEVTSSEMPGWLVATEGQMTLALDVTQTEELIREGNARELVNRIQNVRKDSGLDVTDRVDVKIGAEGRTLSDITDALESFGGYVKAQTLSCSICIEAGFNGGMQAKWNNDNIYIATIKSR